MTNNSVSFDRISSRELLKNYFDLHKVELVFQDNYGNGQVNSVYESQPFDWDEDRKTILVTRKQLWEELAKL